MWFHKTLSLTMYMLFLANTKHGVVPLSVGVRMCIYMMDVHTFIYALVNAFYIISKKKYFQENWWDGMKWWCGDVDSSTTSLGMVATHMHNLEKSHSCKERKKEKTTRCSWSYTHSSFFFLYDISCVRT